MVNRDTLLISCETYQGRVALCSIFEKNYNVLQASTLHQAIMLLGQNSRYISAAIIDLTTIQHFGAKELAEIKNTTSNPNIPILAITASTSPELHDNLLELGIYDLVISPYSATCLQRRLDTIVDLNLYRIHVDKFAKEQAAFLRRSNETIVDTLSSIIEYRSLESGQHILRIRRFTELLLREVARSCPEYNLDEETIQIISSASSLHDIGKISISDSVLNKPGPLTPEERLEIQTHTTVGYRILQSLVGTVDDTYLYYAQQITYCHHERWDGSGYPEGLQGDAIPLCAQVVGLTDAYDALTSKRIYKEAYPLDESVNMILNGECGAFSPKLLECFKQVTPAFANLVMEYHDGCDLRRKTPDLPDLSHQDTSELDTLQLVQSKYQSVLHYLGTTILEIDLDQSTYHIVYNPDPLFLVLNSVLSFEHLTQVILHDLIIPDDSAAMEEVIHTHIPAFFKNRLRRQHHYFHVKNPTGGKPFLYRTTFLRIDPTDSKRRRMLLITQHVPLEDFSQNQKKLDQDFLDFVVFGALDTFYSVRRDPYLTLNRCSKDLIALLGYTPEELKTQYHNCMIELIHPFDREQVLDLMNEQLNTGNEFVVEFRVLHKSGKYLWVLNKGRVFMEDMGHEYLYCLLLDISKSKAAEEVLQETLERQAIILSQTENVIFECDMQGEEVFFSDKWKEMFGYDPISSNLKDRISTASHFHPDDVPLALATFHALQNGSSYEEVDLRIAKSNGHYLWCQIRITVQHDQLGQPLKMVGAIINIDEKKCSEQELKNRAEHDALTNLLNKDASTYYIENFLNSADCSGASPLLVIDLDNFKQVNDQYGHMFGDTIITQSADEIRKLFRSNDIVGRVGGDEFVVLMKNIPSLELLEKRLNSLIHIFSTVLHNRVPEANLGCSIGVALYPQHGTQYQELFRRADQALYQAKAKNKNCYQIYNASNMSAYSSERRAIINTPIDSDKSTIFTIDKLIQYTFQQLYSSGNIEQTIVNMLNLVGQQMNVSRTYIFENNAANTCCSNTFEWCHSGISAEINNLQNLSYETDLLHYRDNFNEQGIFYCPDIQNLPKQQYEILAPQGIKSMLQCAICDNGVFRGFVGFDECHSNRLWTQQQIDALIFFSEIISTFLLKKRVQDETEHRAQNLSSILENQNAWIYVIDPDSFELLFVNAKTKALAPEIREGTHCHRCIMHLDEPCPGCPAMDLKNQSHSAKSVFNAVLDLHVLSEATSIQWNGKPAYLITCREESPED